jgi:replicative DNA helicase
MRAYNLDAEQSVIGSICIDGSCLYEVMGILEAESFYQSEYREIYTSALELEKEGVKVELIALSDHLEKHSPTGDWVVKLATLARNTPSIKNIKTYATVVKEYHDLRRLFSAGQDVMNICSDNELKLNEKVAKSQQAILNLEQGVSSDPIQVKDALKSWVAHLEVCRQSDGGITGISTGYPDLDDRCKGFHPGELIIVAGRPGSGKTNMGLNLASNVLNQGKSVLFFTLEMTNNELLGRFCSLRSNVLYSDVLSANFDKDGQESAWPLITSFVGTMRDMKLYIDDDAGNSLSGIASKARQIKMRYGLDMIVVDYLGLVDAPGFNDTERTGAVSRGLKRLAKDLSCPVVALAQLNRDSTKRSDTKPQLSDLRQSGSIEQDADIVMFVHREVLYDENCQSPGIAELIIRKLRHGVTGSIPLLAQFEYCRFRHSHEPIPEREEKQKQARGMKL